MTIVRCPRCRDEVTVPPRATARALVRCPLCLEQYLLAEALANAPPPLVIIGGEVEEAAIQRSVESDHEYQFEAAAFSPDILHPSAPASAAITLTRPAIRTARRPHRKEKSGLLFLINVIAGGLLAAPLALLTLWWVFGVDPPELGPLGPKVARYAPWIVPVGLRGDALCGDTTVEASSSTDDQTPIAKKRQSKRGTADTAQQASTEPELQTVPALDERPAQTPGPPTDSIDPGTFLSRSIGAGPALNSADKPAAADRRPASPPARPPMPDLKYLLPD